MASIQYTDDDSRDYRGGGDYTQPDYGWSDAPPKMPSVGNGSPSQSGWQMFSQDSQQGGSPYGTPGYQPSYENTGITGRANPTGQAPQPQGFDYNAFRR